MSQVAVLESLPVAAPPQAWAVQGTTPNLEFGAFQESGGPSVYHLAKWVGDLNKWFIVDGASVRLDLGASMGDRAFIVWPIMEITFYCLVRTSGDGAAVGYIRAITGISSSGSGASMEYQALAGADIGLLLPVYIHPSSGQLALLTTAEISVEGFLGLMKAPVLSGQMGTVYLPGQIVSGFAAFTGLNPAGGLNLGEPYFAYNGQIVTWSSIPAASWFRRLGRAVTADKLHMWTGGSAEYKS